MQDAIDRLVATTYSALAAALDRAAIAGEPLVRTRSVERAIEALAGYALGVFAAGVAQRLSLGAELDRAMAIRAALFRATSAAQLTSPPIAIDVDAILDDNRLVRPADLRARVAARLRAAHGDAKRIIAALVEASADAAAPRMLDELRTTDLVATRFREQIERIWGLLHGGTVYLAPPKQPKPDYCVVAI